MNLPHRGVFAYSFEPEARYWAAVMAAHPEQPRDICVQVSYPNDGCDWQLVIEEGGRDGVCLSRSCEPAHLAAAREQVPEFFAAMAEMRPRTIEEVREILTQLGAADLTMRESYGSWLQLSLLT